MVIAYNVRLRGIEVNTLTDAEIQKAGVVSNRRKGSRDNITKWNRDLKKAVICLLRYRRRLVEENKLPIPIKPSQRYLVVSESGTPLTKSALDSAWQRMITMAIREEVITEEQRFSLHGLKHRGVTDTAGNINDKQDAAGHVDQKMTQRYSHDLVIVEPPKRPEFSR